MTIRALHQHAGILSAPACFPRCLTAAFTLPVLALSGCYVAPIGAGPDGRPVYVYSSAPIVPAAGTGAITPTGPMPAQLNVRLYPANDLAVQTGLRCGQVPNLMSGKGHFQFNHHGETLTVEATRVSGND